MSPLRPEQQKLGSSSADPKLESLKNAGWEITNSEGKEYLEKTLQTNSFLVGLDFVNKIAPIAEEQGHHPDVTLTYPSLNIKTTTHDKGNRITDKDYKLAQAIEDLIKQTSKD